MTGWTKQKLTSLASGNGADAACTAGSEFRETEEQIIKRDKNWEEFLAVDGWEGNEIISGEHVPKNDEN